MIVLVAPPAHTRRSGGTRQALVATAQVRLMMMLLVFSAGVLAVLARLALLALWHEPTQRVDVATGLIPFRADIVDRNGVPLARTIDTWSIGLMPKKVINDRAELARKLAALMPERSAADYSRMLGGESFVYLKRRALPELVQAVNALGEPGIDFAREPDRLYPQSELAAHVLGFLDSTGHGARGMEKALDKELSENRALPVALSLDLRVQAALENELSRSMATFEAVGAAGVILDVHTGEVVAMVSLPSFNPNRIAGDIPRNNVMQARYELGSTFKPIAAAAAIDSGLVPSMAHRYDATQAIRIGRFTISDDHPERRWLTIPELLIHSSNIATARMDEEIGQANLEKIFKNLGFDRAAGGEIEKMGTLYPQHWGRATVMTVGYGHGIAVTPMHLASAYAALVNGGIYRPATFRKVPEGKATPGRRAISEATSARMRQLLRLIVTEGTGKKAEAYGYRVGGKTGTAEKPGDGGYSGTKNVTTFAAAFPMDAPRYVVVTMLDSPVANAASFGQRTAAWNAAPVVSRVVTRVGPLLGVIPDPTRDVDVADLRATYRSEKQEHVAAAAR